MDSLPPGSPERSAHDLLGTEQDLMNKEIDQCLTEFRWSFALQEDILNTVCNKTALSYLCRTYLQFVTQSH